MFEKLELQTAIWIYDIDKHHIIWGNNSALDWWESTSLAELSSRNFEADASAAVIGTLKKYQSAFHTGETFFELWEFSPKGVSKKALCRFSGVKTEDNRMAMLVEATSADTFSPFANNLSIAIMATFDFQGNFQSANPPFENEFGNSYTDFPLLLNEKTSFAELKNNIVEKQQYEADLLLKTLSGNTWFRGLFTLVNPVDQSPSILCQLHNIDARKNREIILAEQANSDSLTGLLNRRGLSKKLQSLLSDNIHLNIYYIDLDGFKMINDSVGHSKGDLVLKEAASRIVSLEIQDVICCRFGGDEFVLVIPNECMLKEETAARIVKLLSLPYRDSEGTLLSISASVGIASAPENSTDLVDLIRFADVAMYKSKKAGKKRWTIFTAGMELAPLRKSIVTQHLSNAIENNELAVHYQPIVNVQTGEIYSFEALLRWYNPELGQVSPQELIDVAECIGLIDEIENWVIATAIADLSKLREYTNSTATISINVSSMHIVDDKLPSYLLTCLRKNHLNPADLVIEITESTLLDGLEKANNPIDKITTTGISLSIDDFGTGYSSLAYLHNIKAGVVKIDRAFTNNTNNSASTLRAIHHLIKSLNMKTVLEGVETTAQSDIAKQAGIELHQGYLYYMPQSLDSFASECV